MLNFGAISFISLTCILFHLQIALVFEELMQRGWIRRTQYLPGAPKLGSFALSLSVLRSTVGTAADKDMCEGSATFRERMRALPSSRLRPCDDGSLNSGNSAQNIGIGVFGLPSVLNSGRVAGLLSCMHSKLLEFRPLSSVTSASLYSQDHSASLASSQVSASDSAAAVIESIDNLADLNSVDPTDSDGGDASQVTFCSLCLIQFRLAL
jgi:hypothetical protein